MIAVVYGKSCPHECHGVLHTNRECSGHHKKLLQIEGKLVLVREMVCLGITEDKSRRDELREREVREATLPFETILPSWSRGEPGTYAVAEPLVNVRSVDEFTPAGDFGVGYENDRCMGETRRGED